MADDPDGWLERSNKLYDAARPAGCTPGELEQIALDAFLALSEGARKALVQLHGSGSPEEIEFVSKIQSRAVLKAYEAVLDHRPRGSADPPSSDANDEASIQDEAVEVCRPGSPGTAA